MKLCSGCLAYFFSVFPLGTRGGNCFFSRYRRARLCWPTRPLRAQLEVSLSVAGWVVPITQIRAVKQTSSIPAPGCAQSKAAVTSVTSSVTLERRQSSGEFCHHRAFHALGSGLHVERGQVREHGRRNDRHSAVPKAVLAYRL